MGERLLCKQEVVGSIPSGSTSWSIELLLVREMTIARSPCGRQAGWRGAMSARYLSIRPIRMISDIVKRKDRSELRA